jgi:hypothetical protein
MTATPRPALVKDDDGTSSERIATLSHLRSASFRRPQGARLPNPDVMGVPSWLRCRTAKTWSRS